MTPGEIQELAAALAVPFYRDGGFWIGAALGLASVVFSVLAFSEARQAKSAARQAGRTVKIQTITIELTEIAQQLDKLDFDLEFSTARELLNGVNRRLRRLIAPFQADAKYSESCRELREALDAAKDALEQSRPNPREGDAAPNAIYYAMQGHFATIGGLVAEIMGLFESETIESPDEYRTK